MRPSLTIHHVFTNPLVIKTESDLPAELLAGINKKLKTIMANQAELATDLRGVTAQVKKIGTEIDTLQGDVDKLTEKVTELEKAIAAGEVTQEVTDALAEVKAALQTVDDDIPDVPVPPTQ